MRLKKILRYIVVLILLVLFIYLAFKGIDLNELIIELGKINYLYAIIGTFIGVVIGGYIRALRWRYFLDPIKENIKISNLYSSMMIGYMMNLIIPKSGEVSRPVILAKNENISKTATFGTIIVERVFDMLSLLAAFGICLFYYKEKISSAFGEYDIENIALYSSILILVFVALLVLMIFNLKKSEVLIEKLTKAFLPEKIHMKVHNFFISLINGFLFIKNPKKYFSIFILTVLLWISYALTIYLTFFSFRINLNFLDANLILTMITFAMILPLPGNAAGPFHLFCKTTLVKIFGIDDEVAIGFATVNHLLGTIGLFVIGLFYFVKENYKVKDSLISRNIADKTTINN